MMMPTKFLINVVLFAVLLVDCPAVTANEGAAPSDADVAKYQRCGERLVILLTKFCKGCFYGGGMKPQHFLGKRSIFSPVNRNDRHEDFEQVSTGPKFDRLGGSMVLGEWVLTGKMPYEEIRAEKWAPTFEGGHDGAGLESLDRKTRGRPGIVEKCCHKACSYNELKAYCDDTCPP